MKAISVKNILVSVVVLVAIAGVFLFASGRIERLIPFSVSDDSSTVPVVRYKIPPPDSAPVSGGSGNNTGSADPLAGITRTFIKPSHSEPAEAVRLEISAVEQNNELIIAGKLFDGSDCNRLQIDLELNVDDGRRIFHTLILGSTNQTGERAIRSKRRLSPSSARSPITWRAHVTALRCLDP
jgi:hypothetical protein